MFLRQPADDQTQSEKTTRLLSGFHMAKLNFRNKRGTSNSRTVSWLRFGEWADDGPLEGLLTVRAQWWNTRNSEIDQELGVHKLLLALPTCCLLLWLYRLLRAKMTHHQLTFFDVPWKRDGMLWGPRNQIQEPIRSVSAICKLLLVVLFHLPSTSALAQETGLAGCPWSLGSQAFQGLPGFRT
jgi:hypothetical protein